MTEQQPGKPTVRKVRTSDGPFVLEVHPSHVVLRPVGTRRGGPAEASLPYGVIYQRALVGAAGAPRGTR